MNKKIWIPILCAVLIIVGLALAFKEPIKHYVMVPHHVEKAGHALSKQNAKDIKHNQKSKRQPTYNTRNVSRIGEGDVGRFDPSYLNGKVIVPSVGINLPVLEGVSNTNLNYGAATMKPHQHMGKNNYVLAGHHTYNARMLFTPLMRVQKGAHVYLTDKSKVYDYQIDTLKRVDKHDTSLVESTKNARLTLVTCTDVEGTMRYIVQGKLEKSYDIHHAPKHIVQDLE